MLEPEFCRLDFESHEMNLTDEAEEDDTPPLRDLQRSIPLETL